MTPQQLHDVWLILTVIATLEMSAIAIYLWRMFRFSSRKWFFWALACVLAAVALEHVTAEIKNLTGVPPESAGTAWLWLAGRSVEAIVAAFVLGYLVFGRNGTSTATTTIAPEE